MLFEKKRKKKATRVSVCLVLGWLVLFELEDRGDNGTRVKDPEGNLNFEGIRTHKNLNLKGWVGWSLVLGQGPVSTMRVREEERGSC